ncbi:MAG: TolC family protein [Saprospiraceae bacterium]|nr:TolC family protein [Saprospiraceae bacterium]
MNTKILKLILLIVQFHSLFASAQSPEKPMPAQYYSLKECAQTALAKSTQLKKSELDIAIGKQQIKEVLRSGYPQVTGSANLQYTPLQPKFLIPDFITPALKAAGIIPANTPDGPSSQASFTPKLNPSIGIDFNQLLYSQTFNMGIKSSEKLNEMNELLKQKTAQTIVYEIAKTYYQAQLANKQIGILQANLSQIEGLLKLTELQIKNGFAKKIDGDRLSVSKFNIETQIQNVKIQHEQLLNLLKYQMSAPLDQPIAISDTLNDKNYSIPTLIDIYSISNHSNQIDLSILSKQKELLDVKNKYILSGYYPQAYLRGGYSLQGQGNTVNQLVNSQWFNVFQLSLNIKAPIIDSGIRKSQAEQNRLNTLKNEQDVIFAQQSIDFQQTNVRSQLLAQLNNLQSVMRNRETAEEVYRVSQARFKEGLGSITEILSAETSMREAQTNFILTLMNIKLSEIDLMKAEGRIMDVLK